MTVPQVKKEDVSMRSHVFRTRIGLILVLLAMVAVSALGQIAGNSTISISQENADVRTALKSLFTSAGVNYTLSPAVKGTVNVSLHEVPFRVALDSILRSTASQAPLTYRVEGGVYYVTQKATDIGDPEPRDV